MPGDSSESCRRDGGFHIKKKQVGNKWGTLGRSKCGTDAATPRSSNSRPFMVILDRRGARATEITEMLSTSTSIADE